MLEELFQRELEYHELEGCYGVSSFRQVHDSLMPAQQERLHEITGERFEQLHASGSYITLGFAYPEEIIRTIAVETENGYDIDKWNIYAQWYDKLNQALNMSSSMIAEKMNGITIPATLGGLARKITHIVDYYSLAVSHRVAAELSGVGWRGKNELIVNPKYGCAIRFASVIVDVSLEPTPKLNMDCGNCDACLQACPILMNKDKLDNYREQCRLYINGLGLMEEVCGKCIKACILHGKYSEQFTFK